MARRPCRKITYKTFADAKLQCMRLRRMMGFMHPLKCKKGRHYHIGHPTGTKPLPWEKL